MAATIVSPFTKVSSYQEYVNPQWVSLLNLLEMNVEYVRCSGCELTTRDGRIILDYLSGYCVHNTGHNHPYIVDALKAELDESGPAMLQSHVPEIAGDLAERLCHLAAGGLKKVYFGSSGSEGVEAAIKFARATTKRPGIIYAKHSFHGLTAGALSLMNDEFWREGFGPLLQDTVGIPYGDINALEKVLASRHFAAFIVEPIQAEGGVVAPSKAYLQSAQELCQQYGSLFVLDEVQTGIYRTGTFLAAHQFDVQPDIVILAKALSGGLMPVSRVDEGQGVRVGLFLAAARHCPHLDVQRKQSLYARWIGHPRRSGKRKLGSSHAGTWRRVPRKAAPGSRSL